MQYPGRGERLAEPPIDDLQALISRITDTLEQEGWSRSGRFGFVGHSFGSLVAFATARELRRRGLAAPSVLALGGRPAPQHLDAAGHLHTLPREEFIDALVERYGDPDGLLRDPEFAEVVVPALRADITALETWTYRAEAPLAVPIVAFMGRRDPQYRDGTLDGWAEHTTASFTTRVLEGGHFIFGDDTSELAHDVESLMFGG